MQFNAVIEVVWLLCNFLKFGSADDSTAVKR